MKLLLIIPLILLSSCGFRPMYGTTSANQNNSVQSLLNQIDINLIPDREGQYLRNILIDKFYNGSDQSYIYTLSVEKIKERKIDLDITKSSNATRSQLKLTTKILLKHNVTEEIVMTRELKAITSYNVLSSQFTTKVSEENARNNAINELARQIETRIAVFLNR